MYLVIYHVEYGSTDYNRGLQQAYQMLQTFESYAFVDDLDLRPNAGGEIKDKDQGEIGEVKKVLKN